MKKIIVLLFFVFGLFSLVSAEEPQKNYEFDLMIKKYFMVDVNKVNHDIFYRLNQQKSVLFYPSASEVANLWKSSGKLNPWIKDEKNIKIGTIIIWDKNTSYGRKIITRLGKGETPFGHAYKLLTSQLMK